LRSLARTAPAARQRLGRLQPFFPGLLILLPVVAGCGGASAGQTRTAPPALVSLETVRSVPLEDASEYMASIQSLASTAIKPEVSGEITKILVRSGDRVSTGAPLFVIDPRRQEATVNTEGAVLAAQRTAAALADQQLQRARTLFAAGAISQQDFDQAQANADSAHSQLAAQEARLQQERVTLQYYEVRAPADGVVGDVPVRVGLHVTPDTVLTTVDRNEQLEVDVPVPVTRAAGLRLGLPLDLLDPQGRSLAHSTVVYVSPRVDEQTQSVLVKGRLAGSAVLRSFQFVRARLVWHTSEGLAIPVLSVIRINGQPFVFVAQDRGGHLVAEQRIVQVGAIVGNDVTVLAGLAAGERIVVSGVQKLVNGVPIRTA
jgi:RND family efflux transporter MFP subunit